MIRGPHRDYLVRVDVPKQTQTLFSNKMRCGQAEKVEAALKNG